ncbi:MAG: Nif3-like dinuclear metal center hexameric protein [bacterium]
MRAREIAEHFEGKFKLPLGDEEGFRFGDPDVEVRGVLVCWMATSEAIREALREGCNFIVCHESLFFPYPEVRPWTAITWRANRERVKLLAEGEIAVYRAHGILDRVFVVEALGKKLGFPQAVAKDDIAYVYEIPGTPLDELAKEIKGKLGLDAVRVVGPSNLEVRRLGAAVGGMGLFVNIGFWEKFHKYDVDTVLVGETDEYAIRYALDSGLAVIETAHPVSENPGLEEFAEELRRDFPRLKVRFHICGVPWHYV